jgi:cyclopropane-fatty-acyl-phospholipid synthase
VIEKFINAMEEGKIPDALIRIGIRKLLKDRLKSLQTDSLAEKEIAAQAYKEKLMSSPLAVHTQDANAQHYEVPAEFFFQSLGKNLKYSCSYWKETTKTLDEAEDLALSISCDRAEIVDGMRVLELGCGWGSLTLFMARRFPNSQIVAISNSSSQKAFIDAQALERGLKNVTVLTRDISKLESFALEFETFDRVMSIEMFEHFKNYDLLLSKIADVLSPQGKLFVHIFTHKDYSYPFEVEGESDWMSKYFFTGGQMPAHHLLPSFQRRLSLERTWVWDGEHYQKTCEAWLQKMDQNQTVIKKVFKETYGADSEKWFQRWRVFHLACSELFGYEKGQQWAVSHYLFSKRS